MSRTNHHSKGPGFEYWGRRPAKTISPGKRSKRLTHRAERRAAIREVRQSDLQS